MLVGNMTGLRRFGPRLHVTYIWLAVADAVIFFAACYAAAWIQFPLESVSSAEFRTELPFRAGIFSAMTILAMLSMGLYQPRLREGASGILLRTVSAFALMAAGMAVLFLFFPALRVWGGVFAYAAGMAFAISLLTREVFNNIVKLDQFNRQILVLGAGRRANNILSKMRRKSDHHGFHIRGYVRVPGEETTAQTSKIVTLEKPLSEYVRQHNIHQVVVALDNPREHIPREELMQCRMLGVSVVDILDFFEQKAGKVLVEEASAEWFIFARGFKGQLVAGGLVKRAFDITAGLFLLVFALPFMLITMLAIKLEDGIKAPVIFRQRRVGLNGRVFNVMKFRSMAIDAEADGKARWATSNDTRVTRVGQIIRKLRIDELPQIFNVLTGDMAFVGPRPERPEFVSELEKEIPFFDKRHCVKPGITGWAQLNYPYGASVTDAKHKLEFDLYYVKNQSLYLDFLVLLRTVEVVVFGKGAK